MFLGLNCTNLVDFSFFQLCLLFDCLLLDNFIWGSFCILIIDWSSHFYSFLYRNVLLWRFHNINLWLLMKKNCFIVFSYQRNWHILIVDFSNLYQSWTTLYLLHNRFLLVIIIHNLIMVVILYCTVRPLFIHLNVQSCLSTCVWNICMLFDLWLLGVHLLILNIFVHLYLLVKMIFILTRKVFVKIIYLTYLTFFMWEITFGVSSNRVVWLYKVVIILSYFNCFHVV